MPNTGGRGQHHRAILPATNFTVSGNLTWSEVRDKNSCLGTNVENHRPEDLLDL